MDKITITFTAGDQKTKVSCKNMDKPWKIKGHKEPIDNTYQLARLLREAGAVYEADERLCAVLLANIRELVNSLPY